MNKPNCDCHDMPMLWHKNKRLRAGGSWRCRVRHYENRRASYARTYPYNAVVRARAVARALRRRDRFYAVIDQAGRERGGCLDCGRPYVPRDVRMDWDHRQARSFWISDVISGRVSVTLDALRAELAKCELRCRSCHIKRHKAAA